MFTPNKRQRIAMKLKYDNFYVSLCVFVSENIIFPIFCSSDKHECSFLCKLHFADCCSIFLHEIASAPFPVEDS